MEEIEHFYMQIWASHWTDFFFFFFFVVFFFFWGGSYGTERSHPNSPPCDLGHFC